MILERIVLRKRFRQGDSLEKKAFPGQVITLTGDLGVGKTVFYTGTCQRTWHRRTGKQSDLYDRAGV